MEGHESSGSRSPSLWRVFPAISSRAAATLSLSRILGRLADWGVGKQHKRKRLKPASVLPYHTTHLNPHIPQ